VVYRVNTMKDNGILGNYHIRERTRVSICCENTFEIMLKYDSLILGNGRLLSGIGNSLRHACGQSPKGWPRYNGHILPEYQLGCAGKWRHSAVGVINIPVI